MTLAIQALVSMAVLTVPAMAPAMAELMRVSPSLLGVYIAVLYVGAIVATISAGPLVLRYGAVRLSQWGLVNCAIGMALLAWMPTMEVGLVSAFVTGLGYGPMTPASSHLLARSTPAHRVSLVFSIKQTGVPVGGVMAGVFVPPIVVAAGVSWALWAVCAGCLLCALAAQPLRKALDADRKRGVTGGGSQYHPARAAVAAFTGPLKLVAGDTQLRRLAAVSFVFSTMQMCLAAFLVTYFTADLGQTLVAAGAALAAAQVGGVGGRVLWGWIADRWIPPLRMLALLATLMALCTLATAALQPTWPVAVALVLLVVFGASATGWNGVYLAEVARQAPPGQAGVATGGSLAFTFIGSMLGPLWFGALAAWSGSHRVGYVVLAVPALLCAWVLRRRG